MKLLTGYNKNNVYFTKRLDNILWVLSSRAKQSYGQGSQIHWKISFVTQPLWRKPHAFTRLVHKMSGSVWQNGFKQYLSRSVSGIFPPFICMRDWPHNFFVIQQNVTKDNSENSDIFHYYYFNFIRSHDSSEPVPSTSSEPVDNRPPTQEGKQTSQESASTSERTRSHQAPVKICQIAMEAGSHARGYRKWFWYPSGLHIILLWVREVDVQPEKCRIVLKKSLSMCLVSRLAVLM